MPRKPDGATDRAELTRLESALNRHPDSFTASGRVIAAYLRDNLSLIPFETGSSIAERTGVSEMTVVRFIRSLGYSGLKELKVELRSAGAAEDRSLDDALQRFRVRRPEIGDLKASLELELRAIINAYELTTKARWAEIVDLLAQRRKVFVVGFQATKGTALDFATRLKYARPGIRFAEAPTGVFSEILEADPAESCLVLIDTVAYARKGVLLAQRVRELGMPLVVVTDHFSNWGYEFTDLVLQGSTHVGTFWDSTASLTVILNLLINAVAVSFGDEAAARFQQMRELGEHFQEFQPIR